MISNCFPLLSPCLSFILYISVTLAAARPFRDQPPPPRDRLAPARDEQAPPLLTPRVRASPCDTSHREFCGPPRAADPISAKPPDNRRRGVRTFPAASRLPRYLPRTQRAAAPSPDRLPAPSDHARSSALSACSRRRCICASAGRSASEKIGRASGRERVS